MTSIKALAEPLLRGLAKHPLLTARVVLDRVSEDPGRLPGLRKLPRTGAGKARDAARTLFKNGEITAAVAALPTNDRLRRRYEGELRAYGKDPVPATGGARVTGTPGRVLHLVTNALPYAQAGYTLRTHRILRAQQAAGLDPHAVTQWGWPARDGHPEAAHVTSIDGIAYHRLIPSGAIPIEADLRLARGADAATELVRTLKPAVLHAATDHRNGTVALAVRERTGLPVLYEIRGFLEESWAAGAALDPAGSSDGGSDADMPERMRLHRDRDTAIMAEADAVATLSETMRTEILARGIPAEKIVLTPNAVDATLLTAHHDRAAARREFGLADDEFVVGSVSKLAAYEGFDVLLKAAALLRDRGSKVKVLLVGSGPFRGTLDKLATDLGLGPETLLMPGQVPADVAPRVVAALDVFVCARVDLRVTRLVTPLKPLEAMAQGRPLVLSDLPALRELVDDRSGTVAAELVRPGDAESLAAALDRLRTDSSRCAELTAAGRDVVAERFTWNALAETYRALYARLGATNA